MSFSSLRSPILALLGVLVKGAAFQLYNHINKVEVLRIILSQCKLRFH